MIYFDSSYIVRLYFEDAGFAAVRKVAETDSIACGLHGRAEVIAAFHRKLREGAVTAAQHLVLLKQFHNEVEAGAYQWFPISETVIVRIEKTYASLPANVYLRAADALHLACAAENKVKEIYSNDEKLITAAKYFALRSVNVI